MCGCVLFELGQVSGWLLIENRSEWGVKATSCVAVSGFLELTCSTLQGWITSLSPVPERSPLFLSFRILAFKNIWHIAIAWGLPPALLYCRSHTEFVTWGFYQWRILRYTAHTGDIPNFGRLKTLMKCVSSQKKVLIFLNVSPTNQLRKCWQTTLLRYCIIFIGLAVSRNLVRWMHGIAHALLHRKK